jgi:Phage integrase family
MIHSRRRRELIRRPKSRFWYFEAELEGRRVWISTRVDREGPTVDDRKMLELEAAERRARFLKGDPEMQRLLLTGTKWAHLIVLPIHEATPILSQTFAEYVTWWLPERGPHRSGLMQDQERLTLWLLPYFGQMPLNTITPKQVHQYETKRLKDQSRRLTAGEYGPPSAATINRETDTLKTILKDAVQSGDLTAAPDGTPITRSLLFMMPRLKTIKRRLVAHKPQETKRLLDAITSPVDKVLVAIAFTHLIRIGNVLNIRYDDLRQLRNEEGERIYEITLPKTKNGDEHLITTTPALANLIAALPRSKGQRYLFQHRRTQATTRDWASAVRLMIRRKCQEADIRVLSTHGATRRSGATQMLRRKIDRKVIKEVGGWRSDVAFNRYLDIDEGQIAEAHTAIDPLAG